MGKDFIEGGRVKEGGRKRERKRKGGKRE